MSRFACTPGGAVARGRRRLSLLTGGLALLMAAVAVAAFVVARPGAGVLALLVAAGPLIAWRLAADARPHELRLDEAAGARTLAIELEAGSERLPVTGVARRLGGEEIAHLGRLATHAGIVTGSGSYDSHLLGEVDLYASDLEHAVLVETGERAVVVTPDDPEGFLQALGAAG